MSDDIFILGGARTPMADYTGKLKDFSALELGAIAARAAMERTGRPARGRRPRRLRQRPPDERRRGVRRTAHRPQGGRAHRGAGADGEPAVRLRDPGGHQRRPDDPAGRSGRRPHGRNGEHEPGAARHPRSAERPAARAGPARGHAVVGAARHALRLHHGRDGGELRGEVRHFARGPGPRTRFAASSSPMRRGRPAASRTKSCPSKSPRARASSSSRRTITCGRTRRSRGSRSSRRPSARTAA